MRSLITQWHCCWHVLGKLTYSIEQLKVATGTRDVGPSMRRIRGQKLSVVGFGRIGKAIVPKAKAFGLEVLVYSPRATQQIADAHGVRLVDFPELLAESDFITIHAPLNTETEGIFNEEAFRRMKPTAYILNTSRGGIIETDALYRALMTGRNRGSRAGCFSRRTSSV